MFCDAYFTQLSLLIARTHVCGGFQRSTFRATRAIAWFHARSQASARVTRAKPSHGDRTREPPARAPAIAFQRAIFMKKLKKFGPRSARPLTCNIMLI